MERLKRNRTIKKYNLKKKKKKKETKKVKSYGGQKNERRDSPSINEPVRVTMM